MSREGTQVVISYCVVPVCAYLAEIVNTLFTNAIQTKER